MKTALNKFLNKETIKDIYESRWVWYHTILAGEILFTNIFLLVIIVILVLILNKL